MALSDLSNYQNYNALAVLCTDLLTKTESHKVSPQDLNLLEQI